MPENTPIYGFTYPCPFDTVDATDFATLANQIDAQLLSMQDDEEWALGRYSVIQTMTPSQPGLVQGVETALVNAGSTYVIPADGVYIATGIAQVAATTSVDSARLRLRLNAVSIPGRTYNNANAPFVTNTFTFDTPSAPFVAVTGDTISAAILWFGVGTGTAFFQLHVRMLVRNL
jgi:hypothetical protein